jgi:predicted aspartyl protease
MKSRILQFLYIALFLNPSHAEETGGGATPAAAATNAVRLNSSEWREVPLMADATMNWLVAEVRIGERKALFLIDTGAETTVIDRSVANEWGLKVGKETKAAVGIGGSSVWGSSVLPEFEIAGVSLTNLEVGVNDMPVLSQKSQWGGQQLSGILGVDLLAKIKVVLDVPARRFLLPRTGKNFSTVAELGGLKSFPFVDPALPVVEGKINGTPVRVLLDTGGRTMTVDSGLAREAKLPMFQSDGQVSGGGGDQQVSEVFVSSLELSGCHLTNAGAYGTALDVLKGRARVIAGMESLVPTGAVFDFAGRRVFLREGRIDAHESGLGGPLLGSKEKIAANVAGCRCVAAVRVLGIAAGGKMKGSDGAEYQKFTFRCQIDEVLSGEAKKGDVVEVPAAVPLASANLDALIQKSANKCFRLLFQKNQMAGIETTFMRDNGIRRDQIKGVVQK